MCDRFWLNESYLEKSVKFTVKFQGLKVCERRDSESRVFHKFLRCRIPSKLCTFSALFDTRISVVVINHSSSVYLINAGVPQGSVMHQHFSF